MDVIGRAHEPSATQLSALESSYRSTGDFLSACPEFQGDLIHIHAHGSRQLGTTVRPRDGSREGFDIDLIARLRPEAYGKYQGEHGPAQLLDRLHIALLRYADEHGLKLKRWERCGTLEYAGGMCADIAPVIDRPLLSAPFGDTHALIPDRASEVFDSTNPRGYAKHFDLAAAISPNFTARDTFTKALDSVVRSEITPLPDAQEVFDRLLCRLVQLLKVHRNVAFGVARDASDLAPSSVFLTTLAAMAYTVEARVPHESPLDLLLDIVESMPLYFERLPRSDGSQEWVLPNPSALRDNLAASMNLPGRQEAFLSWIKRLTGDLKRILFAIENQQGMDVLLTALEDAFGRRSANAIRQDQVERRQSDRIAGRVPLMASASSAPITVAARSHTYFGRR